MEIDLRTDGPHGPDYTREVGNALAEATRVLNYATLGDAPGLEYAGDAYSLLGALYTTLDRFPQLLDQVSGFVRDQAAAGILGDDKGRDPVIQAGMASGALQDAAGLIAAVAGQLRTAQNDISGLYVKAAEAGEQAATGDDDG